MAYDIGPTIGIEGEAEFRQGIKNINENMRTLGSEMKVVTSQFDKNDNSVEALSAQNNILNKQIDLQKNKLDELRKGLSAATDKYGKNDKVTQGWQRSVNEATTKLNNLTSELSSNTKKAENTKRGYDEAGNTLDKFGNIVDKASKKTLSFGDILKANITGDLIVSGIKKVSSEIFGLAKSGIGFNSSIETYETGFATMTGSAEKATEVVAKLKKLGAETPFELKDLANTTQLLMNYGFTADGAIDKMTMLGDISQGNAEKMNGIATAYGKMSSAGKVSLEDVKQMIERGFSPLQEISESTGESMTSLYKRISAGTLSVDEITASMQRSTKQGGKYFNSMANQSKTLDGQMSTLKDTIGNKLGEAMDGVSNKLTSKVIPAFTKTIDKIDAKKLSKDLGNVVETVSDGLGFIIDNSEYVISGITGITAGLVSFKAGSAGITIAQSAMSLYRKATDSAAASQATMNAVQSASPMGAIAAVIGLAISGLTYYAMTSDDATDATSEFIESSNDLNESVSKNIESRKENIVEIEKEYGAAQLLSDKLYNLSDKENKSNVEKQEMVTLVGQLNEALPNLNLTIDEGTGYLSKQRDETNKLIKANLDYYKVKASQEHLSKIASDMISTKDRKIQAERLTYHRLLRIWRFMLLSLTIQV